MVLDDSRSDRVDASSARQAKYDPPPHTAGAAIGAPPSPSSSQYIDPLKRACLPRLARERESEGSSRSAPRSLTDRLNQMRVEDRRRERNSESRQLGAKVPQACPAFNATSSASARAGSLYYQSSQLAQQDMTERQQLGEMRRKFAGPTPPTSWRKEIAGGAVETASLEHACDDTPQARKRATYAARSFIDGGDGVSRLLSLSDFCLGRISASLSSIEDQAAADLAREAMTFLPVHLKERMMALAGRKQECEPLNADALRLLLDEDDMKSSRYDVGSESESWEANEIGRTSDPISLKTLDLSFASIGAKMLKSVLVHGSSMHQLRSLSLAGWGSDDRTGQKSLLGVSGLMEAIGNIPHLELLSLAKTRLCPVSKVSSSRTRDSITLESITFLKRLSRASLRLKVLDLSECVWIVGPDIANLGWYSVDKAATRSKIIWPRLEHLVLVNCAAFTEAGRVADKNLTPSPSYVAKWHAAHHGVALVTDSPYLLQHRPGLGNAVFRAEDAQQARLARQRRSARQQARSRDGDAWGSDESQDEDNSSSNSHIRSSSSSAYPTRCPVSGVHVGAWEWERARVLDAVRGRWGSAIKGDIAAAEGMQASGPFIEIYF